MTAVLPLWSRVLVVVAVTAAGVAAAGRLVELTRYGATSDDTFVRVEQHVREQFDDLAVTLERRAVALATDPAVADRLTAQSNRASLAELFELTHAGAAETSSDFAVTVYDGTATARAWSGRPSELPLARILGDATFFIATSPLGLRLVYVEPIVMERAAGADPVGRQRRVGSVSTEHLLSTATGLAERIGPSPLDSPLAPLDLRPSTTARALAPGLRVFALDAPDGSPLVDAVVSDGDLAAARAAWRRNVRDVALAMVALVLVLAALPALARAPRQLDGRTALRTTALAAGELFVACALLWTASTPGPVRPSLFAAEAYTSIRFPFVLRSPADVLLLGLVLTLLAATAARLADVARLAWRHRPRDVTRGTVLSAGVGAGAVVALMLTTYALLLRDTIAGALVDVLYPSLNPWDSSRIGLLLGLLLAAAAMQWLGALTLVTVAARWKHTRVSLPARLSAWSAAGVLAAALPQIPPTQFLVLVAGSIAIAGVLPTIRPWFRHASESARLATTFAFLIIPALLAYPLMAHQGTAAKRRFIEEQFAPAAARQPDALLASLSRAQAEIDSLIATMALPLDASDGDVGRPTPDAAFAIWRDTELARLRLTSAIELYGPDRELISRFALNFPEYAATTQAFEATTCAWDVYGEVSPFGSQERRILHAERGICVDGQDGAVWGRVVVHVPLDYRALPFVPSQSPYYEALRPQPTLSEPGRIGADVDVAIYGWGLSPLFTAGSGAWAIDTPLFDRIYSSRDPFWTTLQSTTRTSDVYFSNNRAGIYALGIPVLTLFDHLVRLAEIVALVGIGFLCWILVLMAAGPFARNRYRFGRELLRELRTSFYRRLFLAFVAVSVVPVLVLAVVIRNYSTAQMRSDAEAGAVRTAVIAQRVIAELREAADAPASLITDDLLVFVSQVIDQNVNIFEGSRLIATSERDLFASGLLPTRTPDAVYEAIALSQAPSFVTEDAIGPQTYLVAAAPLPSAGADAILTVPLASRQREIERQINELDRGILLGVTLLILLGAASGYYIAERIADPVQRLTRATRRIARGDFDARVMTRAADELERLVAAFNRMAEDLKEQRQQLEHTNRLEAWAEMARQVAHEIKNPLTPVQLSAEHLLRVHRDHGEPLGPVLQECVDSILKQVRILRQISSEFSSYASSPPVARLQTALAEVVNDVLESYRIGLDERIRLTVDLSSSLPTLLIDRTLVGRALTNIVENALHAMPGDGTLTVTARARDQHVELVVQDTGVGLDEVTLARIFEPYFSTKVSGTGLGMAIAKRNVELNDGTISVESTKGVGTVITLRFPANDDGEARGAAGPI